MIGRKSAIALMATTLAVGFSCPAMSQEDSNPKEAKPANTKDAPKDGKDTGTVTIKGQSGHGVGRKGNWKIHAQGSPSVKDARKRVEENPKSADAHNDLGWALRQNNKLDEAEKELRKALELDDTIAYGHSNLSVVLLDSKRTEEAVKEGERAVALDGSSPIYRVVYGNALSAAGKLDDAVKQYNEAISLRGDYENALYNLGRVLHMQGKNAEASAVLSQALKLDPSDHRVMQLLDKLIQ